MKTNSAICCSFDRSKSHLLINFNYTSVLSNSSFRWRATGRCFPSVKTSPPEMASILFVLFRYDTCMLKSESTSQQHILVLNYYFTTVASNSTFNVSKRLLTSSKVVACCIPCLVTQFWKISKQVKSSLVEVVYIFNRTIFLQS